MIDIRTRSFWRTCAALSAGAFVAFANIYTTQPLLPLLSEEFAVPAVMATLSVSLVILSLGLSLFLYGPLSDALGRRGIMRFTLTVTALLAFALALAPTFHILLLLRMLQGFFIGGLPALALAYVGEEFSPAALSSAMGVYIATTSLSGISGRLISGMAAQLGGWRWSFLALGLASLIGVTLFFLLLPPSRHFQPKRLNFSGAVGGFARHLKNPVLLLAYLVGGLNFFLFVGQFNAASYLLAGPPFRFPPSLIGALFLTYLAGTASSALSGRITRGRFQSTGIALGIACMLLGILVTLLPSVAAIIGGFLLNSFGFFLAHSLASGWVGRHARSAKASATALYLIFYYLGGSLGSIYLGFFWDHFAWLGVVTASLPILLITASCARLMHRQERRLAVAGDQASAGACPLTEGESPCESA